VKSSEDKDCHVNLIGSGGRSLKLTGVPVKLVDEPETGWSVCEAVNRATRTELQTGAYVRAALVLRRH